jgi:hypothetical protein
MSADERRRLLIGLLCAAHDGDGTAFATLLSDVPQPDMVVLLRSLAETVVIAQIVTEETPGAARGKLARQALALAAR